MSHSYFISGLAISFIYVIIKFIEMKFVTKKNIPLKLIFRDSLIIYLSSVLGLFVLEQFSNKIIKTATQVFTDKPSF
jgi:hypothetical protein